MNILWPSYNSERRGCGLDPIYTWHNEFAAERDPQISHLANILKVLAHTDVTWMVNLLDKHRKPKKIDCFLETRVVLRIRFKSRLLLLKAAQT